MIKEININEPIEFKSITAEKIDEVGFQITDIANTLLKVPKNEKEKLVKLDKSWDLEVISSNLLYYQAVLFESALALDREERGLLKLQMENLIKFADYFFDHYPQLAEEAIKEMKVDEDKYE